MHLSLWLWFLIDVVMSWLVVVLVIDVVVFAVVGAIVARRWSCMIDFAFYLNHEPVCGVPFELENLTIVIEF